MTLSMGYENTKFPINNCFGSKYNIHIIWLIQIFERKVSELITKQQRK